MDTDREGLDALAKRLPVIERLEEDHLAPQGKAHLLLSVAEAQFVFGLAQECLVHRARLSPAVTVDLEELTQAVEGAELALRTVAVKCPFAAGPGSLRAVETLRAHLASLKAGLQEDGIIILTAKPAEEEE